MDPSRCQHRRTKVTDSRSSPEGLGSGFSVVRQRECRDCGIIRYTREVIDATALSDLDRFHFIRYGNHDKTIHSEST